MFCYTICSLNVLTDSVGCEVICILPRSVVAKGCKVSGRYGKHEALLMLSIALYIETYIHTATQRAKRIQDVFVH